MIRRRYSSIFSGKIQTRLRRYGKRLEMVELITLTLIQALNPYHTSTHSAHDLNT